MADDQTGIVEDQLASLMAAAESLRCELGDDAALLYLRNLADQLRDLHEAIALSRH